jgi:polyphenol oxidase
MYSENPHPSLPKIVVEEFNNKIVKHAFLTRNGGVSTGAFASLNCCFKDKDDKKNITENLKIISADFGIPLTALKLVNQVHSTNVFSIKDATSETAHIPADAMVTKVLGVVIGIQTADCTPILFADHENKVIGAAHAGWKGALGGIIQNTLSQMEKLGASRDNIIAVIGPTIAQRSYEVDTIYRQKFLDKDSSAADLFIPSVNPEHYMFDLPNFCARILKEQAVKSVNNIDIDTYSNSDQFFSFRKTTHKGEKEFGGQFSGIMLI